LGLQTIIFLVLGSKGCVITVQMQVVRKNCFLNPYKTAVITWKDATMNGIFTSIYHKEVTIHVGKYISFQDPTDLVDISVVDPMDFSGFSL